MTSNLRIPCDQCLEIHIPVSHTEHVTHEETDCERSGENETFHCCHYKDQAHRMGLMLFFKNLVTTYMQELCQNFGALHDEVITRTEGRGDIRTNVLLLRQVYQDSLTEIYNLTLVKENFTYYSLIVEHNVEFMNGIQRDGQMSSNEIYFKHQDRKRECKAMFQQHLNLMKILREDIRDVFAQHRTIIIGMT